jgi:hypothetical protein
MHGIAFHFQNGACGAGQLGGGVGVEIERHESS